MAISDERLTTRSASVGRLQTKWLLSVASREVNRGRVALRESAQLKTTTADERYLRRRSRVGVTQSWQQQRRRTYSFGAEGKGLYIWNTGEEEKVSPTRRDKSTRDADKGPHRCHGRRELLFAALSHSESRILLKSSCGPRVSCCTKRYLQLWAWRKARRGSESNTNETLPTRSGYNQH